MTTMSAKEAKEKFGILTETVQREPVTVTKHDRPCFVAISVQRYAELEALEDSFWAEKARAGRESGYLSAEASEQLLDDILDVKD